ncbi:hypothetical protein [Dyadobacter sp. NIV53]|uniref:hypothetical protein n=1 Tax=Dyadobacter sp. NIV53 TaxID=2861765 RepID=UPI001C88A765|nr:hypothetical protein [Dyadobacter sp. NIV53]
MAFDIFDVFCHIVLTGCRHCLTAYILINTRFVSSYNSKLIHLNIFPHEVIKRINTKVTIATTIENRFILFDLCQPDKNRIEIIDKIPVTNETSPTILGNTKSSPVTLNGKPGVVIIRIFVMAKMDTRKEAVAMMMALKI